MRKENNNKHCTNFGRTHVNWREYTMIVMLCVVFNISLSAQDITLKIHLRGVYESKITLTPLIGTNALKPIVEKNSVKNRETAILSVPKDKLPAEFILRLDYKEKETSTPYPSEKHIIVNNQNLELWINPPYSNNNDSTWFQKDEKENTLLTKFSMENSKRKDKVALLQNFLMSYDDTQSKFYQQGIEEYEKRRTEYNQWITQQSTQNKALFISHTFQFQYVPQVLFKGVEADRVQSVLAHYFDGIDFRDSLLINTTNLKEWMNSYVNIYGAMAKTETLRDSLFTLAGERAIEQVKLGNPKVYGWMVDYFYNGYESYNIKKGSAMLQKYIDDPNCLTSKKQEIIRRLEGISKLVVGTQAPNFTLNYIDGSDFNFHTYKATTNNKLLLFWSADCSHCDQLIKDLNTWYNEVGNKNKLSIVAVSVDDTDTEVKKWETAIISLSGWKHLRAKGGINSKVANDYSILSTPVMFLVDSKSNKVVGTPDNLEQLKKVLEKQETISR